MEKLGVANAREVQEPRVQATERSRRSPDSVPGEMLRVQRLAGNRAATALVIQAKLTVGHADDPLEREADAVAHQVLRVLHAPGDGSVPPSVAPVRAPALHRKAASGRDPLGGVPVDGAVEDEIDRARGGGQPLDAAMRRAAETVMGTDLGRVRIHTDARADKLSRSLHAEAFTTGTDIFFRKDGSSASSSAGRETLAHELTHVVQQGGAPKRAAGPRPGAGSGNPPRHVQRVLKYGNDPQAAIQPDDKDLLYGINIPRGSTKARLDTEQRKTIRTIDDYNRSIGINGVMTGMNAAMGLYDVRDELAGNGAWGLPIDAALNTATNQAAILEWIDFLRQHRRSIGLADLGEKGGFFSKAKIDKKDRFKKNRAASQAKDPKADRLTSVDIRKFLSPSHTKVTAKAQFDAMSATKQTALNKWVYRAFFRRTSKLGQDFAIGVLHAKVHSITVSEYRHMAKLAKQNPGAFNEYGEI